MKIDEIIGVISPKYSERLLLGKILAVNDASVDIEWLVGTYSGTWKIWKEKGKSITDTILNEDILLHNIILTNAKRLTTSTIKELKDVYAKL